MTLDDFCNLVAVFPAPGQPGFHMARDRHNTKLIMDTKTPSRKAWVWVLVEAVGASLLRFGPLVDFSADVGPYSFECVEEIRGMSEAQKLDELDFSPESMTLTGWFPSFPSSSEDVPHAEEVPCASSSPMSAGLPLFRFLSCDFNSFWLEF